VTFNFHELRTTGCNLRGIQCESKIIIHVKSQIREFVSTGLDQSHPCEQTDRTSNVS
jgi:hypothetical protein